MAFEDYIYKKLNIDDKTIPSIELGNEIIALISSTPGLLKNTRQNQDLIRFLKNVVEPFDNPKAEKIKKEINL